MKPTFEELRPGTVFSYFGPRTGLLRRRGVALGRILAKEPEELVLHVRTLIPNPSAPSEATETLVHVGFLPLSFQALRSSISVIHGVGPVSDDFWHSLSEWRDASQKRRAGVFSVPLWEAESMAWQTIAEQAPGASVENTFIEAAYPVRASLADPFTVVRVSALSRGAA